MTTVLPSEAASELAAAETIAALASGFARAIAPLGMNVSACGMVSGPRAISAQPFHFINWPPEWLALYQAREFLSIDPLPRWAIVSGEAVSWTEVMAKLPPNDPGRDVYETAKDWGWHEGFVTPVRTRSGCLGLISVGGGKRAPFSQAERMLLQGLSALTLNRAETIQGPPPGDNNHTAFTLRERECHALLQQGYTDDQIGRVLGISGVTVRFHLNNARRKAGARNRVHLAAMPLSSYA